MSGWRCTMARVGDWVVARDQSFEVVEIDDYGDAVCRNLNEGCVGYDEIRIFDDLDFDRIVTSEQVAELEIGGGI